MDAPHLTSFSRLTSPSKKNLQSGHRLNRTTTRFQITEINQKVKHLLQPSDTFSCAASGREAFSPLNAALWRLRRRGRGFGVISLDFTCVWTRRVGSGLGPEFGVGRVCG